MSDLQAALLAIGLGVVFTVYVFGWWKQRQYSRKFDAAFRQSHDDALYQVSAARHEAADYTLDEIVMINTDVTSGANMAEPAEFIKPAEPLIPAEPAESVIPPVPEESAISKIPVVPVMTEPCSLLNARSDFIIELHLTEPSLANVLDGLWQRKFDFRKPLHVCGLLISTGQWERVIAESSALYSQLRIALQLVDRSGVISVSKLVDFRDLVTGIAQSINAVTTIPDVMKTHAAALGLDAFCAEVDQMVGINLLPSGDRLLNGEKITEAAAILGMKLEADGAFYLSNAQAHSLITLINKDSKPFMHHNLANFTTPGITLVLDVPRVEKPVATFDLLVNMAHMLARELHVDLVDDQRVPLTEAGIALIRAQIAEVEAKMLGNDLAPGSAQARRLFA